MSSYSRNSNTAVAAAGTTTTTAPLRRFPDGCMRPADSKFCKVCYDAGHPVADYTDHFVKDQPGPDGKVVCATLLKQACRICAKTGHTSSYCPEYRRRPRREEEPRREERYIARDSEYDRAHREDRREDRRSSFNVLREDTERHERDLRNRDDSYYRQQERQSKPWLQAALKPAVPSASAAVTRRAPYAHPHGPRVRLNLEAPALSAATVTTAVVVTPAAAIDVRKVNLQTKAKWGDEDNEQPFLFEANPQQMATEFFNGLTTEKEDKLIAVFDNQNRLPWACSDDEN